MIRILEEFQGKINHKITEFSALDNSQADLETFFNDSLEQFISDTITFIYSGKYVDFLKNNAKVNNINDQYTIYKTNIREELSLIDDSETQNSLGRILEKIDLIIEDLIKCIVYFLKNVVELSNFQNTIIYRNYIYQETSEVKLKELYEYCNVFLLEYFLSEDITFYEHLLNTENRIENTYQESRFKKHKILRFKLSLLKYKWKKRQKYNREFIQKNIDENYSQKFVFVNEDVDLSQKIKIGEEFYPTFEDWINKIELHYFNGKQELIEEYRTRIISGNSDIRDDFDLFFTIKLHKDIEPNFDALNKLKDKIKSSRLSNKNKLYFLNNLFSCLVTNSQNEKQIESFFEDLKRYSSRLQSNNYFIFYKYLFYKRQQIQQKIDKNPVINEIEIKLKECEVLFKECNKKFEWTYKSFNIFYQFDLENCLITIGEDNVYFPTAFLLPISITENKSLIDDEFIQLTELKYKLIEIKNTSYNTTIEKQIKDNEKKSIEMISLFTAVISFIMGSISGFKFVDNIYNAIAFVGLFGICLSIFLILLLKLIREDSKYRLLEFLPVCIAFIVLIIVALSISEKNVVSKENLRDELIKLNVLPREDKEVSE